ncbi:MAG: flagellar basal body protein FliL [Methylobacter sp.]|nr:MAG: flagellar basal body protein FliL [Methylobacter sp.]
MAERNQEGGEGKKSAKTLIIMIVAAVVLLAAGGGATFFLMKGEVSQSQPVEEPEIPVEKLYFDMSKPLVVDFPQGSPVQHGRITVSILVEGAETIAVLKKNEPMIQNNLLMLVGAQDSSVLITREGKEMLRKAILDSVIAVVKKMAAHGYVENIFFTSFVMQ